ncbi:MAG: PH domain-containing protein, partial [Planctomycetota bacterium]|nr:PH domain-containing protein [Planctomycetota bacterium]
MPVTGLGFLVGSLAIAAVPPFNGFASEFAIYRGLWTAAAAGAAQQAAAALNEELSIYKGPLSGVIMIWPVFALIFWVAVSVALFIFGEKLGVKAGLREEQIKNIPTYIALGFTALALGWFLYKWLLFKSRKFLITSERIEYEYGILFKTVRNMDMWRVQDIGFTQSFLDRVLGVGYINIQSSDTSDPRICVGPIGGPRAIYDAVKKVQLDADRRQRVVHVEK